MMEEMPMSMYENLVIQTQRNYSRYYGRYAAGKTSVRLSDREPLPYEKQIEKLIEKIKETRAAIKLRAFLCFERKDAAFTSSPPLPFSNRFPFS